MNVSRCVVLLCLLPTLLGCSVPADWGDDGPVLDELQLLGESAWWVELWGFPPPDRRAPCNVATCQNVLSGRSYALVGDADAAKAAALDELMQTWALTSDADPFEADSSEFQLRDNVEIGTTTGTAFLTVRFMETFDLLEDEPVPNGVVFSITSDADPDFFNDMVFTQENFLSPGGLVLLFVSLTALVMLVQWLAARPVLLLRREGETEALRSAE